MRERAESGLSIKAFCKNAGFHENIYFYWQRKLREAVTDGIPEAQTCKLNLAPVVFKEVKLAEQSMLAPQTAAGQSEISIEANGVRITAGGEYPGDKLATLLREVMRSC